MAEVLANQATSHLAAALPKAATSLTLKDASSFPAMGNFRLVCGKEIMLATAREGNTLTVERGIEGTAAAVHAEGAEVLHVLTRGSLELLLALKQDAATAATDGDLAAAVAAIEAALAGKQDAATAANDAEIAAAVAALEAAIFPTLPTADQKNALAGLHGAPGTGNEYLTKQSLGATGTEGKALKADDAFLQARASKDEVEILNLGTDWSAGDLLGAQIASPPAPHKIDLRDGSTASPVKIGVTASMSRVDATTRAELDSMGPEGTDGHDGATLLRSTIRGTAASEVQISCAVLTATQFGAYAGQFADATPLIARAVVSGGATGRAIAGYLESDIATASARGGQALELRVKNTSGEAHTYAQGAGSKSMGIYLNAGGGQASAAIQIGHGAGQQFDVGVGFNEESIKTASFIDNSSSLRSILVKGSHEKAAIAVKEGAGQVIVGSELPNQATPIFEVYSETAKDPVASLASTDKAVNISGQLARNSAGNVKAFASSAANQFLTGTASGDTGIAFTPGKIFHLGATGKTSVLRVSETGVAFNGAAPVAKAAEIASPAETLAALKIAVDALRTAVKNVGITA